MPHRSLAILRRRAFAILSILSLLLCLATLALWVRSYWVVDVLSAYRGGGGAGCGLIWSYGAIHAFADRDGPLVRAYYFYHPEHEAWRFANAATFRAWITTNRGVAAIFPHWSLALLFAILPAFHLRAILRSRRRHRLGLCPKCGYDLRATPDRCPECGTAATRA